MSLTKGSGPFGEQVAGEFNFDPQAPAHVLYVERTPRRVRVFLQGDAIADSDDVRLLHPPGRTPTYLFPCGHVRIELFQPADRRHSDPGMGERTYWDVRSGEHRKPNAASRTPRTPGSGGQQLALDGPGRAKVEVGHRVQAVQLELPGISTRATCRSMTCGGRGKTLWTPFDHPGHPAAHLTIQSAAGSPFVPIGPDSTSTDQLLRRHHRRVHPPPALAQAA